MFVLETSADEQLLYIVLVVEDRSALPEAVESLLEEFVLRLDNISGSNSRPGSCTVKRCSALELDFAARRLRRLLEANSDIACDDSDAVELIVINER